MKSTKSLVNNKKKNWAETFPSLSYGLKIALIETIFEIDNISIQRECDKESAILGEYACSAGYSDATMRKLLLWNDLEIVRTLLKNLVLSVEFSTSELQRWENIGLMDYGYTKATNT